MPEAIKQEPALVSHGEEGRMNILLTVGNGMMGDDGAGVLLAQMLRRVSARELDGAKRWVCP